MVFIVDILIINIINVSTFNHKLNVKQITKSSILNKFIKYL